jgi:hypothetical protein
MTVYSGSRGVGFPFPDDQQDVTVEADQVNGAPAPDDVVPVDVDGAAAASMDIAPTPFDRASLQPTMNDDARDSGVPFLQNLIDAMRKIAEQTRDEALGQLRSNVSARSAAIRADTDMRAAELREQADADVKAVGTWEQGEMQRIRDEAGAKVAARTAMLESQINANEAAGEGAMAAAQARIEAFEAEMTAFFEQLDEIHDPAALALALKRIPHAPSLEDVTVGLVADTAPAPAVAAAPEPPPEPAAEPMAAPEQVEAAEPVAEAAPVAEFAAEPSAEAEPAPEATSSIIVTPPPAEPETSAPEAVVPEAATPEAAAPEAAVPEPAPEPPAAEAPAAPAPTEPQGPPVTTQVLVTGLSSFGAITSFKQQLERIDGVSEVSLGLGTSGEFVFTAVHRPGFDLSAAIRTFEETAQFVASNGQLRVTVGAKG